jgi:vanillate/4-hydroxybenzoate decarboxylase subunit D
LHTFPRPSESHLSVERTPVEATCPECGATDIAEYRVLAEGGWFEVRKCQACLHSLSREPGPLLGSYVPLGLRIMENG